MSVSTRHLYEFGSFRLDTSERLLWRAGVRVKLEGKVFETLVVLVRNSGHVVHKDEFMNQVWPDAIVEENNLEKSVSVLRKVLGENGSDSKYVETVRGLGYRFAAEVRELDDVSTLVRHQSRTSVTIEDEEIDLPSSPRISEDQALSSATYLDTQALANARSFVRAPATGRWWTNSKLITALGLLAVLAAAGYFFFPGKSKQPETVASIKSIAVLPFKPLSADSSDEYLGLGLTDALITRLGSLNQITVRPTSAVRKYAAQDRDPAVVGRDLRVESVLDGSIQKVGDRFRLTVQLVRVADGKHLWTDQFDEKFTDILNVEDRVSERVAAALALRLTGGEKNFLAKHYAANPEAYELYLRGRYFWNKRTEEDLKKSKEYFEQAIAKDPNCALAYGGLSDYHILIAGTEGPKEAIPKAIEAAAKALALDETLAEPHTVLGFIKWAYESDWGGAEREFKRAIELNPNYELAHDRYSVLLSQMGRFDEAFAEIRIAQELDPFSLLINMRIAMFLYRARQYDRALEQCRKTLELDGSYPRAHYVLALIYEQKGMNSEAIAEIQRAITVLGRTDDNLAQLGVAYALAANRREAMKILNEMKELSKQRYVHPESIALVYASLEDRDQAFEWLDRSFQPGDSHNGLKVDPQWDSLRSDARFANVLRRVGLAP